MEAAARREVEKALADHAAALAQVESARASLETLKKEAESASKEKEELGNKVDEAFDKLTSSLSNLEVDDNPIDNVDDDDSVLPSSSWITYVIENLVNISCYQVYLTFTTDAPPTMSLSSLSNATLGICKNSVQFSFDEGTNNNSRRHTWSLPPLDFDINESKSTFYVQKDHIALRLSYDNSNNIKKNSNWVDTLSNFTSISSSELQVQSYDKINCRFCKAEISNSNNFKKVLALPSNNWSIMTEFWGVGPGSFEHFPKGEIRASPSRVYVGETFILLHQSDVMLDALVKNEFEEIQCSRCQQVLGHFQHTGEDNDDIDIRLSKHVISATSNITSKDVFESYDAHVFAYTDMLEVAESIGCFRFRMQPYNNSRNEFVDIQLLSWNTTLKVQDAKEKRVLKVLYCCNNNGSATKISNSTHVLEYDLEIYQAIKSSLESSTDNILPPSLQTSVINSQKVGFISMK